MNTSAIRSRTELEKSHFPFAFSQTIDSPTILTFYKEMEEAGWFKKALRQLNCPLSRSQTTFILMHVSAEKYLNSLSLGPYLDLVRAPETLLLSQWGLILTVTQYIQAEAILRYQSCLFSTQPASSALQTRVFSHAKPAHLPRQNCNRQSRTGAVPF